MRVSLFLLALLCLWCCAFSQEVTDDAQQELPPGFVPDGSANEENAKPKIQMSPQEYCDSCRATVEYTWRHIISMVARGQTEIDSSSQEFAMQVCTQPPMSNFHQTYQYSCVEMFRAHSTELMEPFLGTHETRNVEQKKKAVFEHTKAFCHEYGHCQSPNYIVREPLNQNDCSMCNAVLGDINTRLNRYSTINRVNIEEALHDVCRLTALRHAKTGDFDDMCWQVVEDNFDELVNILLKRRKDPNFHLLGPVCTDLLDLCPDFDGEIPDDDELREEL